MKVRIAKKKPEDCTHYLCDDLTRWLGKEVTLVEDDGSGVPYFCTDGNGSSYWICRHMGTLVEEKEEEAEVKKAPELKVGMKIKINTFLPTLQGESGECSECNYHFNYVMGQYAGKVDTVTSISDPPRDVVQLKNTPWLWCKHWYTVVEEQKAPFKIGDHVLVKQLNSTVRATIYGTGGSHEPGQEWWWQVKYPDGAVYPVRQSDLMAAPIASDHVVGVADEKAHLEAQRRYRIEDVIKANIDIVDEAMVRAFRPDTSSKINPKGDTHMSAKNDLVAAKLTPAQRFARAEAWEFADGSVTESGEAVLMQALYEEHREELVKMVQAARKTAKQVQADIDAAQGGAESETEED